MGKHSGSLAPDYGSDLNDDGALAPFTAAELAALAQKLTQAAAACQYEAGRRSVRGGARGPVERASQIPGASSCGAIDGGWTCTRVHAHFGEHVAHTSDGVIRMRWGGPAAERREYEAISAEATSAFLDVLDELAASRKRLAATIGV